MKTLLYLFLLLGPVSSVAQFIENFDDGDFSSSPVWQGDTALFIVQDQVLRLDDRNPESSNRSYLSVPVATSRQDSTTWELLISLEFSPSGSNFAEVVLAGSNLDLRAPQAAYVLRFGGISGDDDAVELRRQDEDGDELLIRGRQGGVAADNNILRTRVTRSAQGQWTLSVDYAGGTDFELEGTAVDTVYPQANSFGIVCQYTSSRATLFSLDDIRIDPLFVDRQPPRLLSAEARSADTVRLRFDEPLNAQNLREEASFTIDGGIGAPDSVFTEQATAGQVDLLLATPLVNLNDYTVEVRDVTDKEGNLLAAASASFDFIQATPAAPGDLIITEIMADPTPVLSSLPEAEYLELYNFSAKVLQLGDLQISTGGTPRNLPPYLMLPGTYLTLCELEVAPAFELLGPALGMDGLPALTNNSDEIQITDLNGNSVTTQFYSREWFQDPLQEDGGYALERIDRSLSGSCAGNWTGSPSALGGSPGQENPAAALSTETNPPSLLGATPLSAQEILVRFDEAIDLAYAENPEQYIFSPVLNIESAIVTDQTATEVLLLLQDSLLGGIRYELQLTDLLDCLGNLASGEQQAAFGLPEIPLPGELLISEVLYFAQSGGSDFVELYNASSKIIDLTGLRLINQQKITGGIQEDIGTAQLLFPGEYIAIAEEVADVALRYPLPDTALLLENDLPTLESGEGNISIQRQGVTLDSFDYSEDLHSALLDETRGVSLERISFELPSGDLNNWQSAAEGNGFATPGYANSQRSIPGDTGRDRFSLQTKTFSPNGDGFQDQLQINYAVDRPGFLANVRIFDAEGRPVRELNRNSLLAPRGFLIWDGSNEDGDRARTGIYVIWIEVFNPEGEKEMEKKVCVLANRL